MPTMRSQLVGPALALVRRARGDADGLIARFRLPKSAERDAEVVLPLERLHAFFDAAEAEARDPFLGVHIAQSIPRGAYGLMEFACRSAPTVGAALERFVRYISLLNELVEVTLDGGVVEQRIVGQPLCVGRHGNEFFAAMLVMQARQLTGSKLMRAHKAWFAHPRPRDVSLLVDELGTDRIEFDRERNGIALPPAALAAPLSTHEPALLALLDRQAEAALSLRGSTSRFLGPLRQTIRDRLRDGVPTLEEAARANAMSARTLQRRLSDEGTSWNQLVEEVRKELAVRWVEEGARPLGEIAFLLGYSELSAFLRALKRWTGRSASELRPAAKVARAVNRSGARGHRRRAR